MNDHATNKLPLVSCVVTCYKKVPYLIEAIDSVLMQDYPRIELLVTDDGTVDFPSEEISNYIEKKKGPGIERYVVFHHEVNVGTVKNMNGISGLMSLILLAKVKPSIFGIITSNIHKSYVPSWNAL